MLTSQMISNDFEMAKFDKEPRQYEHPPPVYSTDRRRGVEGKTFHRTALPIQVRMELPLGKLPSCLD